MKQDKAQIERDLGFPLVWEELLDGQDSRISVYLDNANPETDWKRQQDSLAEHLNEMHHVFAPRIKELDSDPCQPQNQVQ